MSFYCRETNEQTNFISKGYKLGTHTCLKFCSSYCFCTFIISLTINELGTHTCLIFCSSYCSCTFMINELGTYTCLTFCCSYRSYIHYFIHDLWTGNTPLSNILLSLLTFIISFMIKELGTHTSLTLCSPYLHTLFHSWLTNKEHTLL